MAYEKARELLDLALALSGSHYGLSAAEIEDRLAENGKSNSSGKALERQRQRMLTQIEVLFGAALEVTSDEENRRRWTLRTGDLAAMPLVDPADMAALDRAAGVLGHRGDNDGAARIGRLKDTLQTALDSRRRARFEVDFEALREAQAVVAQPGPRIEVDPCVERAVTEAILKGRCLAFEYASSDGASKHRQVEPVGVLLGPRRYLVARLTHAPVHGEPGHWRMDRIIRPVVCEDVARSMPEGFSLADRARQCFGVYWNQDEYDDVEWRFAPRAAASVVHWRFHPDQTMEHHDDGSVTVRFRASGSLEMAWHLYQWGDAVEVIAPKALVNLVKGHRRSDFTVLP